MRFNSFIRTFITCAAGLSSACAYTIPSTQKATVKECKVPADQANTFLGEWMLSPLPIAFAAGHFSDFEKGEIKKGLDVWNAHFTKARAVAVFDYNQQAGPSQAPAPSQLCRQGIVDGKQFTNLITIYKQGVWEDSLKNVIAITSTCPSLDPKLPKFTNAMMELNYQNFFVTDRKPDLASIIVHELGHLAGLNHSCEDSGTNPYGLPVPSCKDPALPLDYFEAVMYPTVSFSNGVGVSKMKVNKNDQGRANCLFNAAGA